MAPYIGTLVPNWSRGLAVFSLLTLLIGASGCADMAAKQDFNYWLSSKLRAERAWRSCYRVEQRKCLKSDFAAGFKQGYYDTAIGKDCRVPPVAPPKYWGARYQSCEGQKRIQQWFAGYQNGISAAESQGVPYFADVPVSAQAPILNRTACGKCQSQDPCNCNCPASQEAYVPWESQAFAGQTEYQPLSIPALGSLEIVPEESDTWESAPTAQPPLPPDSQPGISPAYDGSTENIVPQVMESTPAGEASASESAGWPSAAVRRAATVPVHLSGFQLPALVGESGSTYAPFFGPVNEPILRPVSHAESNASGQR